MKALLIAVSDGDSDAFSFIVDLNDYLRSLEFLDLLLY